MAQQNRTNWRNLITILSIMVLIGTEVFGVAISAGWAIAGLFELGDIVGHARDAAGRAQVVTPLEARGEEPHASRRGERAVNEIVGAHDRRHVVPGGGHRRRERDEVRFRSAAAVVRTHEQQAHWWEGGGRAQRRVR